MMKGQFMVISAIIAALTVISLSAEIQEIQEQKFETDNLQYDISTIKSEIKKITEDDSITNTEEKNFTKMLDYYEYKIEPKFDKSKPCIKITVETRDKTIRMPCIN